MIFTDGVHLISNKSLEELHNFARLIGLGKWWFHDKPYRLHYDLMKQKTHRERTFNSAIKAGAIKCTSKELVIKLVGSTYGASTSIRETIERERLLNKIEGR